MDILYVKAVPSALFMEYALPRHLSRILRGSLPKTGPLRFGSENQFPLNFAHEYILVQK